MCRHVEETVGGWWVHSLQSLLLFVLTLLTPVHRILAAVVPFLFLPVQPKIAFLWSSVTFLIEFNLFRRRRSRFRPRLLAHRAALVTPE